MTRICAGEYEYKGYSISRMPNGWVIAVDNMPTDVLETLRDAKALIDHYTGVDTPYSV